MLRDRVQQLKAMRTEMRREYAQKGREIAAITELIESMEHTKPAKRSGSSTGKRGRVPTTQIAIADVMADGSARTPREIAEILGVTTGAASAAMGRMSRSGVLRPLGAGRYRREDVEPLRRDLALPLDDPAQEPPDDTE
jgi:hypothetical protein